MTTSAQSLDRPRGGFRIFADLSLRVKLILVFLVVTLLAVGIIALLNIRSTSTALTTQVSEGLVGLAGSAGHDIGAILADQVVSLQSLAQNPEVQAGVAAQNDTYSGGTEAILAELTELDEQWVAAGDDDPLVRERLTSPLATDLAAVKIVIVDFAEVFVTDRYGGLVATSDRTSDYYQADEGWWQAAYNDGEGAVFVAPPELDESTGVIGVDIAVPVYAQNNEVMGIMRTTLDVTALLDRLGHITLGETGGADLFLEEEVFEAHHAEHEVGESNEHHALDPVALAQITTVPDGYVETDFDGQPSLVGYAAVESLTGEEYISDLGWKVLVHQAQSEALAAVTAQTRNTLLLALLVAVIVVVVAVTMGQVLASPIARLTGVVTRFTEGDLSARVDIDSRDETGVLAASFNQMAEQVGTLLTDVQARSAELEERTRELEASQGVTFAASERTSPEELLGLVVDLVRDQFDLYHVQMYMVDEKQQAAVLRESTGYAGSQLLQQEHQISLDQTALVTKAIREKEPVLVDDTGQDPNFMPNPLLPETQTELVVPLRVGDRVLGALDIQDSTPNRFSEGTIALFQAMTDQVAFLFENNELLERVTDQTESLTIFTTQLRTASDIAEQLSTILDPEQMLHEMAELLQNRFGLYHAHIYVLDEAKRKLVVRAGSGEVGRVLRERGHSIPLDAEKSLVARAARTGEPVLIEDTSLESDFMPNPLLPQTRSELSVPLVVGERVLGVLDIQDDQADRFGESDVDTFSTLAGPAASSLQNAALFGQVEANAQETEIRFEVSQALASARTEEEVLDVLIQQMGIYPQTRPSIFTVATGAEELTVIVRRQATLDSGLPPLEEGMRLAVSQFPSLQDSAEGKPFMSSNLLVDEHVDPAVREIARMTGALSELSLPLMAGGEYLGVISVSSPEEGFFDERKLHLYQTLADQGTGALRTARLRDELQESLARFNGFSDATDYGFGIADLEGNITFVNPALLRMLGEKSTEAVRGKKLFEYYPPEKEEVLNNTVLPSVMEEGKWTGELELLSVDGRRIPTEESLFVIRDEHGNPHYIADIITDITERKQAEQELLRLGIAVEQSIDGIAIADLDANIQFVNPAWAEMHGHSVEELQGKHLGVFHTEEQLKEDVGPFNERVMETGAHQGEVGHVRKDGTTFPAWMSTTVLKDKEGKPVGLVGTARDITEQVQAEREREQQRTLLDSILASLPVGVWVADKDFNVLLTNEYQRNVMGREIVDRGGSTHTELYDVINTKTGETYDETTLPIVRTMTDGQPHASDDLGVCWPDGTVIPLLVNSGPLLDAEGNQTGAIAISTDISERMKAEDAIRESEERLDLAIEAAEASVWEFWPLAGEAYFSDRWFTMLGYEPGELPHSYETWASLLHPDDLKVTEPIVDQCVQEGGSFATDFRMKTKDGDWRWMHSIGKTVETNEDGVATRMLGTHTDVTEEKLAQVERERFTIQLRTAADIAGQVSAVLDPDKLLNTVIPLLKERFNLYYAHFYRLDEAAGELVLSAGYGKPGRTMLKKGHSIPLDREQSLVAQAARTKETVVVHDVTQDPGFLPNPLLPHTKSEVAVPVVSGDRVLGVFDVQHDQVDYFTEGDLNVFSTLAGQVATALQNASLFETLRKSKG